MTLLLVVQQNASFKFQNTHTRRRGRFHSTDILHMVMGIDIYARGLSSEFLSTFCHDAHTATMRPHPSLRGGRRAVRVRSNGVIRVTASPGEARAVHWPTVPTAVSRVASSALPRPSSPRLQRVMPSSTIRCASFISCSAVRLIMSEEARLQCMRGGGPGWYTGLQPG